ncbi:hypothetical protein B0A50_07334 [Salinomyces thailandicus]|uniref:Uncharacterized protein n=1 Tax=Salinomyces thailandicus TaxID=706561 RepID=A0A4U0TN03_9PEZI|nr:hypothetical protein B0A50_07334 [Salinomyces thailandica]
MAASTIPPPIVQSTYLKSPEAMQKSVMIEKPSPMQERQRELEADLQFLLDAQAEGLAKGVGGGNGAGNTNTSTGSTTPTAYSVRSAAKRGKRPVRKRPGLRSARKGIYNGILALSAVKEDELRDVDAEVQDKEGTLSQIDEWEQKRLGLQEATREADDSEETVRAQRLRQEADMLQEEIIHVELQLADMKGRHRKLVRQVLAAENSVQAKLASYTNSLSMMEQDVQKFLSLKPEGGETRRESGDGKQSIWELPPKRRTLDMAREHYTEERDAVMHQRRDIEREKSALTEGAAMWKDVVAQVTDFEKQLQSETSNLSASTSASAWEDPPQAGEESDMEERTSMLLQGLEGTVGRIEAHLQHAEEQHWILLIAAIGAELDALRQGRRILRNILGIAEESDFPGDRARAANDLLGPSTTPADRSSPADDDGGEDGNGIHELDKSFETARPVTQRIDESDTDGDDPDPELLFSKPKVDGDDDSSP